MAAADIVLLAPAGGASITLGAAHADAVVSNDIVLDLRASPVENIRLFPPGQGDTSPDRTAFLIGAQLTSAAGVVASLVAPTLLGQAATTTPGITPVFITIPLTGQRATATPYIVAATGGSPPTDVFDSFTAANGTALGSHTPEIGATWTVGASGIEINSGRIAIPAGHAGATIIAQVPTAPLDYNVAVEALLVCDDITASGAQYIYARVDPGFITTNDAGGGYSFGWNSNSGSPQWELRINGAVQVTSTTNLFTASGQSRTVRLEVHDNAAGTFIELDGFVDGVRVATFNEVFIVWPHTSGTLNTALSTSMVFPNGSPCSFDSFLVTPIRRNAVGQAATATAGALVGTASGGSSTNVVGLAATTAQGTLVPEVAPVLLGQRATTTGGIVIAGALLGRVATTAQGTLTPVQYVGSDGTVQPLAPTLVMNFPSRSFAGGDGYKALLSSPMSVGGVLRGVYEDHGVPTLTSAWDPGVQGKRHFIKADGTDSSVPAAAVNNGEYDPFFRDSIPNGRYTPNGDEYDYNVFGGGHYSVDKDGAMHWVHTRAYAIKDPTFVAFGDGTHSRPRSGDILYIYQSDYNVAQEVHTAIGLEIDHSLPLAYRRNNVPINKNNEHAIGLYAHTQHNVLLFYPEVDVGGPALTGLRATASAGLVLTPQLVGAVATTAQGTLRPSHTSTTRTLELVGLRATSGAGSLTRYDPANVVPTYVRGDGYAWATAQAVQLRNYTGATECFALRDYFTVARSGYDDTIYMLYLSGTAAARYTPAYIGMVVLDAVTGKVYSHTLTAITGSQVFGDSYCRPVLDVARLSSGTNVTQFTLNGYIFHLSWTSATRTAPTLTQKTKPTGSYLPGFESFDYRGDEAYHTLFQYSESGTFPATVTLHIKAVRNDATGSGSTWTIPGSDTFSVAESSTILIGNTYTRGGNSGYGEGLQTWMSLWWIDTSITPNAYPFAEGALDDAAFDNAIQLNSGLFASTSGARLQFGYSHWATQADYLTVKADARVGTVGITIVEGVTAALTGQGVTGTVGTMFGAISGALTGLAATTAKGDMVPATGGGTTFFQPLLGLSLTTAAGTVFPVQASAPLTGLALTTAAGVLAPTAALTGQVATATPGLLALLNRELAGLAATASAGVAGVSTDAFPALTGLRITTGFGQLGVATTRQIPGLGATTAAGTIVAEVGATLTGLRATTSRGLPTTVRENLVPLLGQAATLSAGLLTPATAVSTALVGRTATGTAGLLTPNGGATVAGLVVVSAAGTLVPVVTVSLTGQAAVSSRGVLTLLTNIFLTGRSGTLLQGTLGYQYGGSVVLSTVWATGVVGDIHQNVPDLRPQESLWVQMKPTQDPIDTAVKDEFVLQ